MLLNCTYIKAASLYQSSNDFLELLDIWTGLFERTEVYEYYEYNIDDYLMKPIHQNKFQMTAIEVSEDEISDDSDTMMAEDKEFEIEDDPLDN